MSSRFTARRLGLVLGRCAMLLLSAAVPTLNSLLADGVTSTPPRLEYEGPEVLTGAIYAKTAQPERLLYNFKRIVTRSGSILNVLREYTYPDGKTAARERVLYNGNTLAAYELEEFQTGAMGSAKIEPDPKHPAKAIIAFQFTPKAAVGSKLAARNETLQSDTIVNDMVGVYVAEHWEQLLRGDKVSCRYLALSRKETVGLTFSKVSDSTWHEQDVVILKMEPTSLFISALVDPLLFTVQKAPPHRVLQYVGRTTPKIADGGRWKDLDAVTVFNW